VERHTVVGRRAPVFQVLARGVPPVPAVTGANRHDVSQLRRLFDSFVIDRPDISGRPRNLCLGKGYSGEPSLETAVLRGFIPRIAIWKREREAKARDPHHKARRRAAGVSHSWLSRFRKLPVRFEELTASCLGLLMFGCAFIASRNANVI
jgi:hypothetical protein